jgi:glycosyltransferase involved in cell wall biosynthesis
MKTPKVLVGIVTYNRPNLLQKAIDSIISQSYSNLELVVLDNGSNDSTRATFENRTDFKFIHWKQKKSIVEAKNFIMQKFDYDFFVGLDDDAWFLDENSIQNAIDFINTNNEIAILALDILSPQNKSSLFKSTIPFIKSNFIGCGCVIRKSALDKVNYYSKMFGYYGVEEEELSLKILNEKYEIYALPGIFVWHEMYQSGRNLDSQWQSQVCNNLYLILKLYPFILAIITIPYKILSLAIFSYKNKKFVPFLNGVLSFIMNSMTVIRYRQPVKVQTIIKFHKGIKNDG